MFQFWLYPASSIWCCSVLVWLQLAAPSWGKETIFCGCGDLVWQVLYSLRQEVSTSRVSCLFKSLQAECFCNLLLGLRVASGAGAFTLQGLWHLANAMGYNNKWHHIQQTSPGVSPTSISNLSGFLCPVSVYNALEMAILVILTLRIHVKLVQRLVRGRPDPLGPGPSHSLWVWTESGEGMEGSDRHPYDPAFLCVMGLCAQLAITDVALKLTPSFWPVVTPLFYAACHVQHDCNIFCLTHIQLYLLLF